MISREGLDVGENVGRVYIYVLKRISLIGK